MKARSLLLLAAALAPAGAAAQATARPADPTAVATAFFAAVAAERWRDAAAFLDLEAFEGHRQEQISIIRSTLPQPPTTAEELMRREPDMPRAAAEYQARKMNEMRGQDANWIAHEYAGVTRLDSLVALTPIEAAARWLQAQDPRDQMRRALAEARARHECPDSLEAVGLPGEAPRDVVGAVVLDTVAYVLHRDQPGIRSAPADSSERRPARRGSRRPARSWFEMPPAVMQLRRVAGEWRIFGGLQMLTGGMSFVGVTCEEPRPGRKRG